jgi:hypothetical protein
MMPAAPFGAGAASARLARAERRRGPAVLAMAVVLGVVPLSFSVAATPGLSIAVVGNRLVNGDGQTVHLLGVDRSGSEYECVWDHQVFDGPTSPAAVQAMVSWHIDAVRLPLNEDCWLGINGVVTGGARYREAIVGYVKTLESAGLYVVLDLHWAAPGRYQARSQWPMADATHAPAFWVSVATTFKADHGVLFDLFNEPYITSWPCWEHGCQATYDDNGASVKYQTAGMQQLVDAVRSTRATTPLMLGGLSSASDASEWRSFEPVDPDHQLVVSFHSYNFAACNDVACWDRTIAPLAKMVPVVTGELGENGCTDGYDLQYMPWADSHGISYLGWAWDAGPNWPCGAGPALISSYDGTPTPYGAGLKAHLAALAAR